MFGLLSFIQHFLDHTLLSRNKKLNLKKSAGNYWYIFPEVQKYLIPEHLKCFLFPERVPVLGKHLVTQASQKDARRNSDKLVFFTFAFPLM